MPLCKPMRLGNRLMPEYRPDTLVERILDLLTGAPGALGARAQLELRRKYMARTAAVFQDMEQALDDTATCLDLGANYGRFTERLAATGAKVHAFEPDPDTFQVMKDRVGHLPNVTLHQCAIAAQAGTLTLHRLPEGVASSEEKRTQGATLLPTERTAGGEQVDVEVRAFKDVLTTIGTPVDIVKMDIEGAELDVLDQVFAAPGDYPVKTLFVETHERQRPDHLARVTAFRKMAGQITAPDVHLYWP